MIKKDLFIGIIGMGYVGLPLANELSKYFKVKSNIIWLSDKKRGFHLNMSNAIKNYNFKTINTEKSIIKYLIHNYPKNA